MVNIKLIEYCVINNFCILNEGINKWINVSEISLYFVSIKL